MTFSNKRSVLDRPEPDSTMAAKDLRFDLTEAISPDAMENNADSLMDAVFADVDRMLERGVSLPIEAFNESDHTETNDPEQEPSQPVMPLESILPPKLSPRDLIPRSANAEMELAESATPADSALEVLPSPAERTEAKKSNRLLWFAVLFSSMLFSAAILSYLFRDQLTQIWLRALSSREGTVTATAPTAEATKPDSDFLKYIQRSLDRLANQSAPDPEATQPSPTIAISPAASPTVVERVYVPVYPSPQPSSTNAPGPVAAKPPTAAPNTAPADPPAANPNTAPTTAPNIAATTHTLIGVLALGERSAALFEIDGTPQRIEIGGQIGSSGWTLVSINNQEAIVRKNGEVRSIYVGQKF